MKQVCCILISFCIINLTHAQKSFRGEIIYRVHTDENGKKNEEFKVLFGNNKLKLLFKENEADEKETLIIDLDSGISYLVNPVQKTFNRKMLASWLPVETVPNKTYDGFTASAMHQDNGGLGNLLGVMWGSTNAVFYLADSLYYFIPEKYKGNKELILLQKNRIVLGAEIEIVFPQMRTKDSLSKIRQKITAEAISITQLAGNDNEFIIPADFVNKQNYAVATDTTIAVYDSTAPVPAKEAVRKKGPVEKPVPKSTSSSKAIRRKE